MVSDAATIPMCADCGHFFTADPGVGRAYAFLYGDKYGRFFTVEAKGFREDFEEAVLDMGNEEPEKAAAAVCYALTAGYWPEPEDLQAAVLHRRLPGHDE